MRDQSHPPAGWYPVGDSERYWDGLAWTDQVRAPAAQTPGHPAQQWPAPQPHTWATNSHPVPPGYVAPKSPGLSLLASFFIPGLGSIINGDVGKGLVIMLGYFVSCLLVIILVGILGVVGFWVWGLVDAYQGARLWNARHGLVS
jgi:TM2 domain-containing membrane protein YozV